jgi:predicted nucleotidyltransferase
MAFSMAGQAAGFQGDCFTVASAASAILTYWSPDPAPVTLANINPVLSMPAICPPGSPPAEGFGSYAYGQPHRESDVDLLVVMPAANEINQAICLTLAFEATFSLDLIVRTPENLRRALEEDDWFLSEVVSKGKVLYGKTDGAMGAP